MFNKLKLYWKLRVKHMDVSDYHIEEHRKRGMKIGGGHVIFSQMTLLPSRFWLQSGIIAPLRTGLIV